MSCTSSARHSSAAFTVSIGVPPPTVTTLSAPARRIAVAQAIAVSMGVCSRQPVKMPATASPSSASMAATVSVRVAMVVEATMSARSAPIAVISRLIASAAGVPQPDPLLGQKLKQAFRYRHGVRPIIVVTRTIFRGRGRCSTRGP